MNREKIIMIIKKYKGQILFFGFFIVLALSISIAGHFYYKEIEENKAFTTGQITNAKDLYRPAAYNLEYTYSVNGIIYENVSSGKRIAYENYKYFEGKYFPVIYSTRNPKKAGILITPYAFEAWGLSFPDSLEWVKDYLYF